MDVLTLEKAPVGMPPEYTTRIGIPELNRAFRWIETEQFWGTQITPVRHKTNVLNPVLINMVNVVSDPGYWMISKYLYLELSHRPAMGNLQEVVI